MSPASTATIEPTDDVISNLSPRERRVKTVDVTRVAFDGDSFEVAVRWSLLVMGGPRVGMCVPAEIRTPHLRVFADGPL